MVKIWIDDELLDMEPESNLSLEYSSPLFENEVQRGEFSYPFTIPLTERNKRLLNNPQFVNNPEITIQQTVYFERLNKKAPGVLFIDAVDYNYTTNAGRCECTLSGVEGLFLTQIEGKKLADLEYDGVYPIPVVSEAGSYNAHSNACLYATSITNGTVTGMPFVFPMLRVANFGFEAGESEHSVTSGDLIQGFYNFWTNNPWNHSALTGPCYEYILSRKSVDTYDYQRLVPMFYRKWVLVKVFEEFGYTLTGDFLDDATFNAIVLQNNFTINKWISFIAFSGPILFRDRCTEIDPRNHMPDISIIDFLNDTCKNFNVQLIPVSPTEWKVVSKTDLIGGIATTEIAKHKINPNIRKMLTETAEVRKGTNLEYTNSDTFYDSAVLALDYVTITGEVANYAALPGSPADGNIYYVLNEDVFYQYSADETDWYPYTQNSFPLDAIADGNAISFGGTPVAMELASFDVWEVATNNTYEGYFPYIDQAGNYYREDLAPMDRIYCPMRQLLYFGLSDNIVDAGGYTTPYAAMSNYDYQKAKQFDWGLGLYGTEGIYNTFYKDWDAKKANSIKYTVQTYITEGEAELLVFDELTYLLGQYFLIYSKKFTSPYLSGCYLEVYKI